MIGLLLAIMSLQQMPPILPIESAPLIKLDNQQVTVDDSRPAGIFIPFTAEEK